MKSKDDIRVEVLQEEDIPVLTEMMTRAFDEDTRIHLGQEKGGPPGYDTGEFLRQWGLHKEASAFKLYYKEDLMGSIILWIREDGSHFLGNIFLDVAYQNQGLGKKIWSMVEESYPDAKKWMTDTPGFSKRNHHFYINKCGFKVIEIKNPGQDELYILEKVM